MNTVRVESPAKVNLVLEVLGRRPDGYHEVSTVLQAVGLYDTIVLRQQTRGAAPSFTCNWAELETPDNLCLRALRLAAAQWGHEPDVGIELTKRIPFGAGLGGGSGNAAAVLAGLAALWNVPASDADLECLGLELGADVPFFVRGGTAFGSGIGGTLKTIDLGTVSADFLVAKPEAGVSTAAAYRALAMEGWREPLQTRRFLNALPITDVHVLGQLLHNDFESAVCTLCPEIRYVTVGLKERCPVGALLSGSGAAVFGLIEVSADCDDSPLQVSGQTLPVYRVPVVADGVRVTG